MDYSGMWEIISGAGAGAPAGGHEVRLEVGGGLVQGQYRLGDQQGALHGRLEDDGSVVFTSEGDGQQAGVRGAGTMRMEGDRLQLTWRLTEGQEYTFVAARRA